jgi:radical SAM family uncharacterized protein/radical SAM-linked protein
MNWEDILLSVEKPSRYTGGEVNAVRKDHQACDLLFALAFPDSYEVGMSHLGFQILYGILNQHPRIVAERCYAPWPDMERQMRRHNMPLATLESRMPLNRFDVVGFSLQYELSYTNILNMLDLAGIPLRREARTEADPLIIAGGPGAFNPAPMARFVDAFVIGEGEEVISEIAQAIIKAKHQGLHRQDRLTRLAEISGIYVPSLHSPGLSVRKRIIPDINQWPWPQKPIVPLMQTIHDRVTLEIARGCTRGCRFCQAGMVWRPVRERNPDLLAKMADETLCGTGHNELSLLSLSTGDYSRIEPLLTAFMERYHQQRIALALPSMRVETLTRALMEQIRRVRKTSFTLAPEAGTQRLRNVINKGNSSADLLTTVQHVFDTGWKSVKLYFMLGLPTETGEDMEGIVDLAYQVLAKAKNRGQVTVSLSTFVPKPHTPLQWSRQLSLRETLEKQAFFKGRLRSRHLSVKWHDARMSLLEGVISRGDERIGQLIENAFRAGCRFDGWSDQFRFDPWEQAMGDLAISPEEELRQRPLSDPLPWDNIDCGVRKDFLIREWRKSTAGELTPDCRTGSCDLCGVCDHEVIKTMTATEMSPESPSDTGKGGPPLSDCLLEKRLRIQFTKLGPSRFLSHLEISTALIRAINQSGLSLVYSEGFHPHPKISFAFATAVGMESEGEFADIQISMPRTNLSAIMSSQEKDRVTEEAVVKINSLLPEGMTIRALHDVHSRHSSLSEKIRGFHYQIFLAGIIGKDGLPAVDQEIRRFLQTETFHIKRELKGKPIIKNIRPFVTSLQLDQNTRQIGLSVSFGPEGTVRPMDILTRVCGIDEETARSARILKTGTLFKDTKNIS